MIPKSFGLLFYLKKPRGYAKGERPIYLRITVDGVPKEMSIQRSCNPGRWNSETRRAADMQKLNRSEISIGIDGGKWIFTRRQKTDTASRIPLLPMAQDILDRYADHPQCQIKGHVLPILSNQKMNAYLKEIADCCGIKKLLTFHIARHTFATTITLSNGVPIETVSKMLGHRNPRTTQHYAKILDRKVSQDMQALKEKLQAKPALPPAAGQNQSG